MKKYPVYSIGTILILLVTAGLFFYISDGGNGTEWGIAEISGRKFKVEIMDDTDARKKGLGGRDDLCHECGMAFLFDRPGKYSFWMRDMRFPLDIIWANKGKVVFLAKNVPADSKEAIYPPVEASLVLEINSGLIERYDIREGDEVGLIRAGYSK